MTATQPQGMATFTTDDEAHSTQRSATLCRVDRYSLIGWVLMAKRLHPSHASASAMQSCTCSGVKHATTGLWSRGDTFAE